MSLKIATRLWIPTIAMAGLLALVVSTVALRTSQEVALTDAQLQGQESKLVDAATWQGLTTANAVRVLAGLTSADSTLEAALKPDIEATSAVISEIEQRIETAAQGPDEKAALARIASARKAYIEARSAASKARAAGDDSTAKAVLATQVQPALTAYQASQQAFVALQQDYGKAARAASGKERMHDVWTVVAELALFVVGLGLGTVLLARSICRPMDALIGIARRIGEGDLDVEIDARGNDEIGAVMQSLTRMRDALRGIVGQVRQAAESIQVASAEVASGNADLSQRTEEAASHLQQTASSLAQLTGNVRQSADAAAQANQLAVSASAVAQRGGEVVSQVVRTMDEINGSSKRIADIVGTIDGIAFQTNILALNAAVEAARAGEQGRGFAVVASEVRSLAQRSADAAREIKGLIGASVEKVAIGARLVQSAGSTMGEIVASVQRVSDIVGEITAAASEQSSGIGLVNGTVASLDQMTQQNAALVEQSAAAAESLREQAQRLSVSMQVFRLSGGPGVPPPAAAAVALRGPGRQVRQAPVVAPARPVAAPRQAPAVAPARRAATAPADSAEWESF